MSYDQQGSGRNNNNAAAQRGQYPGQTGVPNEDDLLGGLELSTEKDLDELDAEQEAEQQRQEKQRRQQERLIAQHTHPTGHPISPSHSQQYGTTQSNAPDQREYNVQPVLPSQSVVQRGVLDPVEIQARQEAAAKQRKEEQARFNKMKQDKEAQSLEARKQRLAGRVQQQSGAEKEKQEVDEQKRKIEARRKEDENQRDLRVAKLDEMRKGNDFALLNIGTGLFNMGAAGLQDGLTPFLKIAPPISTQQVIEFSKVYRLPLSQSFLTVYNACYAATYYTDKSAVAVVKKMQYTQQHVRLIDLRPRRWYRELAILAKRKDALEKEKTYLASVVEKLAAIAFPKVDQGAAAPTAAEHKINVNNYYEALKAHENIIAQLTSCNELREAVINEVLQNGYMFLLPTEPSVPPANAPQGGGAPSPAETTIGVPASLPTPTENSNNVASSPLTVTAVATADPVAIEGAHSNVPPHPPEVSGVASVNLPPTVVLPASRSTHVSPARRLTTGSFIYARAVSGETPAGSKPPPKGGIYRTQLKSDTGTPLLTEKDLDAENVMSDETKWSALLTTLTSRLIPEEEKERYISSQKKELFEERKKELISRDSNPKIKKNIEEKKNAIVAIAKEIKEINDNYSREEKSFEKNLEEESILTKEIRENLEARRRDFLEILEDVEAYVFQRIKHEHLPEYMLYPPTSRQLALTSLPTSEEALQELFGQIGPRYIKERLEVLHQPSFEEIHAEIRKIDKKLTQIKKILSKQEHQSKEDLPPQAEQSKPDLPKQGKREPLALVQLKAQALKRIHTCESRKKILETQLKQYEETALTQARAEFIAEWNDPMNYDKKLELVLIPEDIDPFRDFYKEANAQGYRNISTFTFRAGNFYTDSDQPLQEFMSLPGVERKCAIFPCLDETENPRAELFWGVMSPQKMDVSTTPKYPIVKFIETNELQVSWDGYVLSTLMESVNLFPGEKKQIVIEKQTKLTREVKQSRSETDEKARHLTSSFEENLRSELSTDLNLSHSEKHTQGTKYDRSVKDRTESETTTAHEDETSWNASGSASASGVFKVVNFGGKVEGGKSGRSKNNKGTRDSQSKETALLISQSEEGQTLNTSSRDVATKNIQGTINKVSSETSSNNKLEIASSSSEHFEESTANKESLQIENPNMGCTINYNFYQVQNVYKTRARLKDVKIVIDTGIEVLDGVGITAKCVCELEEFNKLIKLLPKSMMNTVLCAFIARRVLKHYAHLILEPTNTGILRVKTDHWEGEVVAIHKIKKIYEKLNLLLDELPPDLDDLAKAVSQSNTAAYDFSQKTQALEYALRELQKFTFVLDETPIARESKQVVNAPAYHVDTQLGKMPATESYLEARRATEIEGKKSDINHRYAQASFERRKDARQGYSLADGRLNLCLLPPPREVEESSGSDTEQPQKVGSPSLRSGDD